MYYNIKNFDRNVSELFEGQNIEGIKEKFFTDSQMIPENKIQKSNIPENKELIHELYSEINKRLLPFVLDVIEEYKYDGSPIYRTEGIDRETLAQMVDKVIEKAKNNIDGVDEIITENSSVSAEYDKWERIDLLRNVVSTMLLMDIYCVNM